MGDKKEIMLIDEQILRDKVYTIRGQKVMLDFDLAEIYGYSTKNFNRQVSNNSDKFDDDFRFQLNVDEFENLRWHSLFAICLHRARHLHAHDRSARTSRR